LVALAPTIVGTVLAAVALLWWSVTGPPAALDDPTVALVLAANWLVYWWPSSADRDIAFSAHNGDFNEQ
jgi:hypothetical protein